MPRQTPCAMEMHHQDFSYTILGSLFTTELDDDERCWACRGDYYCAPCECPRDMPERCVAVLITLTGCPVTSLPCEVTYCIQIWDFKDRKSMCTVESLCDREQTTSFSLTATIAPEDMEHMYVDLIKRYKPYLMDIKPSSYSFKAPFGRDSYLKGFKTCIDQLLKTKDRPTQPECAHVQRRKKGHRHG